MVMTGIPSKHAKMGHYLPTSEKLSKWRFTGRLIVAQNWMPAGIIQLDLLEIRWFCYYKASVERTFIVIYKNQLIEGHLRFNPHKPSILFVGQRQTM